MSQKLCQHNGKCDCSKTNVITGVNVVFIYYIVCDIGVPNFVRLSACPSTFVTFVSSTYDG